MRSTSDKYHLQIARRDAETVLTNAREAVTKSGVDHSLVIQALTKFIDNPVVKVRLDMWSKCLEAYELRAQLYLQVHNLQFALKDLDAYLTILRGRNTHDKIRILIVSGGIHLQVKNYSAAEKQFDQALQTVRNSLQKTHGQQRYEALIGLALARIGLEKWKDAETHLTRCTRLQEYNPKAFLVRANLYKRQEKYRKAIADLNIASNLSPEPSEKLRIQTLIYNIRASRLDSDKSTALLLGERPSRLLLPNTTRGKSSQLDFWKPPQSTSRTLARPANPTTVSVGLNVSAARQADEEKRRLAEENLRLRRKQTELEAESRERNIRDIRDAVDSERRESEQRHQQEMTAMRADIEAKERKKTQQQVAELRQAQERSLNALDEKQEHELEELRSIIDKMTRLDDANLQTDSEPSINVDGDLQVIAYTDLRNGQSLGVGSFGTTILVTYNGQPVVVKKLALSLVTQGDNDLLTTELTRLAGLTHPHLASPIGYCNIKPNYALVMQHYPAGNLTMRMQQHELTWEQRYQYAHEVALGIQYLHAENVIHGNIKGTNILITQDGHTKLADSGLMELRNFAGSTTSNYSHQSAAWNAPEELDFDYEPNLSADIYAYGLLLWHMVTCAQPLSEFKTPQAIELALEGLTTPTLPPNLPDSYRDLILNCWRKAKERIEIDDVVNVTATLC